MNPNEVSALIIGAGIALLSSLVTTLVAALINHWLLRRSQHQDKIAKLHYLTGKMAADVAKDKAEIEVGRNRKSISIDLSQWAMITILMV